MLPKTSLSAGEALSLYNFKVGPALASSSPSIRSNVGPVTLASSLDTVNIPVVTGEVNAPILILPAESPVIHTGLPSPDDMDNWSEPVALATSAFPITTLFEPLEMLSPA